MITNALRMVPDTVKGFKFLNKMRVHMTSYAAEAETENDEKNINKIDYPRLTLQRNIIVPVDSYQDNPDLKRKRTIQFSQKAISDDCKGPTDSNVRKFHKKFR